MKRLFSIFAVVLLVVALWVPVARARAATTNLVPNASLETAKSTNVSEPQSWNTDAYGTNTSTFSYSTDAHTGLKSVRVDTSAYTNGDAKWFFDPIAVTPNTKYSFSDWYKSNIYTDALVQFRDTSGNYSYRWVAGGNTSSAWKQMSGTFTTPANVTSVTILHLVAEKGWLQVDDMSVSVYQNSAPVVSVTSPSANSTVTGAINVTAIATDAGSIAGVSFAVDGSVIAPEDTVAPYSVPLNTAGIANGTHKVTATARNADGIITVSSAVTFTVANTGPIVDGSNIVPNASLESASSGKPQNWATNVSKTNNAVFTYLNSGHTGARSTQIKITNYTNGDAFWSYPSQPVEGGQLYEFSDWYKSNVETNVYAEVQMQDGSTQWLNIGLAAVASPGWYKFYSQFRTPAGAKSIMVYHSLAAAGTLTTDDYQLNAFKPTSFNRPIVSLTFDDGIRSVYTNGKPVLDKYGFKSTQYLLSGTTNDPYYMDKTMMQSFANSGHEIGSHTVTHPHLTTLTAAARNTELRKSQTDLLTFAGAKPMNFASPYGEVNSATKTAIQKYYRSQRGVKTGYNSKGNFDIYDIKVQDIVSTTTPEEVAEWVNEAMATKTWLVLVYHATDTDTINIPDAFWNTTPTQLDDQFRVIKNSGITVETVDQALNELTPQL